METKETRRHIMFAVNLHKNLAYAVKQKFDFIKL